MRVYLLLQRLVIVDFVIYYHYCLEESGGHFAVGESKGDVGSGENFEVGGLLINFI